LYCEGGTQWEFTVNRQPTTISDFWESIGKLFRDKKLLLEYTEYKTRMVTAILQREIAHFYCWQLA
jgi:hypothetical protein